MQTVNLVTAIPSFLQIRQPIAKIHWEILSYISYIGCGLSAFFTALSLVIYVFSGWVHMWCICASFLLEKKNIVINNCYIFYAALKFYPKVVVPTDRKEKKIIHQTKSFHVVYTNNSIFSCYQISRWPEEAMTQFQALKTVNASPIAYSS